MTKILFHALGATMGGAQRHLTSFLPALSAVGEGGTYNVLVRESVQAAEYRNIQIHRVPDRYAAEGPCRLWFDAVAAPRLASKLDVDAVVSLTNIGPIRLNVPHIIFQRNALLFSPEHMALFRPRQIAKFRLQRFLAQAAMNRAECIITPSHAMAALVQKDCPDLRRDRFFVLPHAFDPAAYTGELDPATQLLLRRSGAKLLYPSLAGPHKGFSLLLQIAKSLPKSLEATIYVTGGAEGGSLLPEMQHEAKTLGVAERVVFLGRIRQSQMGALYRACDLLLYVSPIESFGLPLLEAMAFNLPIVALDTPTNRELCGAAARYFPKENVRIAERVIAEALMGPNYKALKDVTHLQFTSRDRTWQSYATTLLSVVDEHVSRPQTA